jgi:signal peptidase II
VSRRVGLISALVISAGVFLADQWLKRIVEGSMRLGESVPIVPGVFHLTYIKNEGGAFGILAGQSLLLLVGSVVAVAAVLWMLLSGPPSKLTTLSCGLVLGGAAGNLLDRLTTGAVTDYLDIRIWPIFNTADVAITLGVALLLLSALLPENEKRENG